MKHRSYAVLLALFLAACGPKDECESQADCNDDNACTEDVCSAGTCDNTGAVAIDDNNACTTDACDPVAGVTHDPIDPDDDNECTTDACDPITGVSNTPIDPNDNNACTDDDCDPDLGVTNTPIAGIDDGNACTTDACETGNGTITHDPIDPDDNNECTVDDCDPILGVSNTTIDPDDGDACTVDDCDPILGVSNTTIDPDDNNVCTIDDCDAVTGVSNTPIDIDDDNECTVDDCDPITGESHTPVAGIDDNIDCTDDVCDPATGTITHTEDNTQCAEVDGATCTLPTCDAGQGGCVEEAINFLCGDSQACTTADVCNPAGAGADPVTGCTFTIDNAVCDDSVGCTDDVCAPFIGCSNTANDGNCQSGEFCDPTADCLGNVAALNQGVITEFMALGTAGNVGEFIEIHNPDIAAGDIGGGTLTNAANQTVTIRPVSNPTGTGLVVVPPGGFVFGVPNPANAADIPPGAAFVYGDPGTTFEIADAGDDLTLRNNANATLDAVDFVGNFVTDASAPFVSPNAFPGFGGVSTQLDPAGLNTVANGDGANWCTTFRLFDTAGAPNLSCAATTVVINELVYDGALGADTADARKTFIELAGPGGARITDLQIRFVETDGGTAGNLDGPNVTIGALLANARIRPDGFFVIADNTGGDSQTVPANERDIQTAFDGENNSQAVQLLLTTGGTSFVDAVAYVANAGELDDTTDNTNNLPLVEGSPALDANQGISLARNLVSEDTNDNSIDFVTDPSPSPGVANQPVNSFIASIVPDDGLLSVTTPVVITGTDLGFGATITFAGVAVPTANCNFSGTPTTITCNIPPGTLVSRGDVTYVNTADRGGDTATVTNGWTYTGVLNETDVSAESDFCNIQFPATTVTTVNVASEPIFGQLFEAGLTDVAVGFPAANVLAELGFALPGVDPTTTAGWIFNAAQFNVETGTNNNNDEYQRSLTFSTPGTFAYAYRFSIDGGLNFTYCDTNGAGSNGGLTFEVANLGSITVNP